MTGMGQKLTFSPATKKFVCMDEVKCIPARKTNDLITEQLAGKKKKEIATDKWTRIKN